MIIIKNNKNKLYFIKCVELKQILIKLLINTDNIYIVKEIIEYFDVIIKEYIIYIIINRIELNSLNN